MSELVALSRKAPDMHYAEKAGEALTVLKRIVQTERDQKADEDRIDAAIARAETEIAALERSTRESLICFIERNRRGTRFSERNLYSDTANGKKDRFCCGRERSRLKVPLQF